MIRLEIAITVPRNIMDIQSIIISADSVKQVTFFRENFIIINMLFQIHFLATNAYNVAYLGTQFSAIAQ